MMGVYLTTLRNRKFELVRTGTSPNARPHAPATTACSPTRTTRAKCSSCSRSACWCAARDFYTTFLDPGNPLNLLNTYAEDDISTLARVFTGLSYDCTQGTSTVGGVPSTRNCGANNTACTGIGCRYSNAGRLFGTSPPGDPIRTIRGLLHPDWYRPMVCYPRYNDNGRDMSGNVLAGPGQRSVTLPAGSPPPNKDMLCPQHQHRRPCR